MRTVGSQAPLAGAFAIVSTVSVLAATLLVRRARPHWPPQRWAQIDAVVFVYGDADDRPPQVTTMSVPIIQHHICVP